MSRKRKEFTLTVTDQAAQVLPLHRGMVGSLLFGAMLLCSSISVMAQGSSTMAMPKSFATCEGCHSIKPNQNFSAPTLAGVFGRHAGTVPGYDYSEAMRHADIVWNATTLDAYLTNPQHKVPGNEMAFPGLSDKKQRAAIIAYLQTLSGR